MTAALCLTCTSWVATHGFQCEACARTLHADDPAPRFAAVEVPVEWEEGVCNVTCRCPGSCQLDREPRWGDL